MTHLDADDLAKRIAELEQQILELERGVHSHKMAIESLMRTCDTLGLRLTENREDLLSRINELEKKPIDTFRRTDKA